MLSLGLSEATVRAFLECACDAHRVGGANFEQLKRESVLTSMAAATLGSKPGTTCALDGDQPTSTPPSAPPARDTPAAFESGSLHGFASALFASRRACHSADLRAHAVLYGSSATPVPVSASVLPSAKHAVLAPSHPALPAAQPLAASPHGSAPPGSACAVGSRDARRALSAAPSPTAPGERHQLARHAASSFSVDALVPSPALGLYVSDERTPRAPSGALMGGERLDAHIELSAADGGVLGLHLARAGGVVVVHSVDHGRAAALAGVRAADLVERVNERVLLGGTVADFEAAVRAVRECAASGTVTLTLRRGLFLPPSSPPPLPLAAVELAAHAGAPDVAPADGATLCARRVGTRIPMEARAAGGDEVARLSCARAVA